MAGPHQQTRWLAALLELRRQVSQARERPVSARNGVRLADEAHRLRASAFPGLYEAVDVPRMPVGARAAPLRTMMTFSVQDRSNTLGDRETTTPASGSLTSLIPRYRILRTSVCLKLLAQRGFFVSFKASHAQGLPGLWLLPCCLHVTDLVSKEAVDGALNSTANMQKECPMTWGTPPSARLYTTSSAISVI